jgi:RNA polymerase-binding protein DksA
MAKKALRKSAPAPKRPAPTTRAAPTKSALVSRKSAPVAAKSPRMTARPSRDAEASRPTGKVKTSARRPGRAVPAVRQPLNPMPPVIIPQRPVPTDGKPRRNQAGLTPRELEHYRELLLAKRRELVGDMSSMEREALRSAQGSNLSNLPLHMADMGTDNYEQEFTLGLVEKDRQLLREINRALAKIQDGTYGICEGTGKPISKPRLEAQPWAKYSIEYARQMERGMIRR